MQIAQHLNKRKSLCKQAKFTLKNTSKATSSTDCSSSISLLIEIEPLIDDYDLSTKQIIDALLPLFKLHALLDKSHKFITHSFEWLTTIYEVEQGYNPISNTNIYQYITIVHTDLSLHITITNPKL